MLRQYFRVVDDLQHLDAQVLHLVRLHRHLVCDRDLVHQSVNFLDHQYAVDNFLDHQHRQIVVDEMMQDAQQNLDALNLDEDPT